MRGVVVVNHYLYNEKFASQTACYLEAADRSGVSLSVRTNAEKFPPDADFCLFLDKDVRLAYQLEKAGIPVYNSARSIALCDDKSLTFLHLAGKGFPMPETLLVPLTFFPSEWKDNPFVDEASERLGFPMVVKENKGSFGGQVRLAENRDSLVEMLNASAHRGMLVQSFVASSFGRDVRVLVAGGKPVASMLRRSENDFRSNVSAGGKAFAHTPTPEQEALAVSACAELGLTFGGVDMLFGEDEKPLLCEVNSNSHIVSLRACTGINAAESILQAVCEDVRRRWKAG